MWVLVFERLAFEFIADFFYFPVWWYTRGARRMLGHAAQWSRTANMQFAPGVWLRNIFVPMFGQYDWQGRIVSFFIRLANVIGRAIALCIWLLAVGIVFFFWLAAPLAVLALLIASLA